MTKPTSKLRKRVQVNCTSEYPIVDQSAAKNTDINWLVDQYRKTGTFPGVVNNQLAFMDLTNAPDLATAMTYVREANENFMQLPARVRAMMDNDPRKFESFVTDPENEAILVKYGLKEPKKEPTPVEPPPFDDDAAKKAKKPEPKGKVEGA